MPALPGLASLLGRHSYRCTPPYVDEYVANTSIKLSVMIFSDYHENYILL
jgi:hypothetical protein